MLRVKLEPQNGGYTKLFHLGIGQSVIAHPQRARQCAVDDEIGIAADR
jgi:hypothetical protein